MATRLKPLPPELSNPNASHLGFFRNGLSQLPTEVWKRPGLTTLYISENPLTSLPDDIGQLAVLRDLNLEKLALQTLPPGLAKTKLVNLNLNALPNLDWAQALGVLAGIPTLRALTLNENDFSAGLPPALFSLTSLRRLFIFDSKLQTLPPEIGLLTALEQLSLGKNALTALPAEVEALPNLKSLLFAQNPCRKTEKALVQRLKKRGVSVG